METKSATDCLSSYIDFIVQLFKLISPSHKNLLSFNIILEFVTESDFTLCVPSGKVNQLEILFISISILSYVSKRYCTNSGVTLIISLGFVTDIEIFLIFLLSSQ